MPAPTAGSANDAGRGPGASYRALPRLRRRRSAGLSLRGLGRGLEPEPDAPAVAVAARPRIGARRLASRQMKNEIPPRRASAPIAIASTLPPLRPLDPEVEEVGVITVGVVAVGIVADGCGRPGASGFDGPGVARFGVEPWASATGPGATAAAPRSPIAAAASRPRTTYASGCSIAGVSGASA